MSKPDSRLRHSIGFHMGITYRKINNLLQSKLSVYDLTPEQWVVLFQVGDATGSAHKHIAARSGKDRPTTTRILKQLEEKGFIYKAASENDRRSFSLYLTEKGKLTLDETVPIERNVIEDIKQCMSDQEYEQFMTLLFRIDEHIQQL